MKNNKIYSLVAGGLLSLLMPLDSNAQGMLNPPINQGVGQYIRQGAGYYPAVSAARMVAAAEFSRPYMIRNDLQQMQRVCPPPWGNDRGIVYQQQACEAARYNFRNNLNGMWR